MIKLIILDVDGVLTDGKKYYDENGNVRLKTFCDKDWTAIKRFRALDVEVIFLTGDPYNATIAKNRNIDVYVNRSKSGEHKDKVEFLDEILNKYNVKETDVAYAGDDIFDIRIMKQVGYAFCPSDAPSDVKMISITLNADGGDNFVMHLFEYLRRKQLIPEFDFDDHLNKVYDLDKKEKF